jgi:polar amino acid transport system ATP-binding protein
VPDTESQQGESLLQVRGVHKWLGGLHVLKGVDLEVRRGEIVVIIGPSGSGKSTLLRCINHLEAIDAGEIRLGEDSVGYTRKDGVLEEQPDSQIARTRRRIGFVFQQFNLFPHMTAIENVSFGPRQVLHLPKDVARQEAMILLERVGLKEKAGSRPHRLSGGQQQRVAIARALAMKPDLMLFDEPTSSLDPELVAEVLGVMQDVARDGMTMIVVTHEIEFARQVGNELVVLDGGEVIERGPCAEVIQRPQQERTALFLRSVRRPEARDPTAGDLLGHTLPGPQPQQSGGQSTP